MPGTTKAVEPARVLVINSGSSSIKFALYRAAPALAPELTGVIDRVGLPEATLTFKLAAEQATRPVDAPDFAAATGVLLDCLHERFGLASLAGIGHRVVHGMQFEQPQRVTPQLLQTLREIEPFAPNHLPGAIRLIEAFANRAPELPQVACFDTAFHRTMPRVASLLPIPRRFAEQGVQRYGFHGLSYAYLVQRLSELAGPQAARGRVILAHLGNGASLAAVREGRSIDTSMGFTPAGGIPMSSRPGDLDPGVAWRIIKFERLSPDEFNDLINRQSGLLGLSETSSDMRDLLEREATDPRAAEAIGVFCYQVKKFIGAFAAALGGLDTLVFSAGIGERSPVVRARVCQGLEFLGIELDEQANAANAPLISRADRPIAVRVIPTDEASMIAQSVCQILGLTVGAPSQ